MSRKLLKQNPTSWDLYFIPGQSDMSVKSLIMNYFRNVPSGIIKTGVFVNENNKKDLEICKATWS